MTASEETNVAIEYPALYTCADEASNQCQRAYLCLIRVEYLLLFIAAVLALNFDNSRAYFGFYTLVLGASMAALIYRTAKKPEQDWYKCRALAESVKTASWCYMMRAEPFSMASSSEARSAFRDYIADVLKANASLGAHIARRGSTDAQTTTSMNNIRALRWEDRRQIYLDHRIKDQRDWYTRKAEFNRKRGNAWPWISGVAYGVAISLAVARVAWPENIAAPLWPIGPLMVLASIVLGWTQVKKFNELASVYALTDHEIGLVQEKIQDVDLERELAPFVSEAELAFSREHTQWMARQTKKFN